MGMAMKENNQNIRWKQRFQKAYTGLLEDTLQIDQPFGSNNKSGMIIFPLLKKMYHYFCEKL